MLRILNLIFTIIIGSLLSFVLYTYNTINEINFSIQKRIEEINKIKENINKMQQEENKKTQLIDEISSSLEPIKHTKNKEVTKYLVLVKKRYDAKIDNNNLKNGVKRWKYNYFMQHKQTNYTTGTSTLYYIVPNQTFKKIKISDVSKLTGDIIRIVIDFNYSINQDKLIDTIRGVNRYYNLKFLAQNYQSLFTYLNNIQVKYNVDNQIKELNLLDMLDKYSIVFNEEERSKIKDFIKNKIYEILNK